MSKRYFKAAIAASVRGISRTPVGRVIDRHLLESAMRRTHGVSCRGQRMTFATPNWLSQYRIDTFSTKEPETLDWLDTVPAGSTLWDVGANIGLYAIYAAKARRCCVYAFEPSVFNLELLARNVAHNGLQHDVTIVPLALGDSLGVNSFRMSSTEWGGALSTFAHDIDQSGASLKTVFEYQIVGISLDDAVDRLGLARPQHLKVDVDGIEHIILRGGSGVLKDIESVLIEINDDFADQSGEATEHLTDAGLVLYRKCDLGMPNTFNQWWRRPR